MIHAVLDTHALVWFLQKDRKLSKTALEVILSGSTAKIIPFIVMCEIHYLHHHGRFETSLEQLVQYLDASPEFEVLSHRTEQLRFLENGLDIHDALIVAAARDVQSVHGGKVVIVTKDAQITKLDTVDTVW